MIKNPTFTFLCLTGSILWIGCDSKTEKKDDFKTNKDSVYIDEKEAPVVLPKKKPKVKKISSTQVNEMADLASQKVFTDYMYSWTQSELKTPGVPNQIFYIDDATESSLVNRAFVSDYINYDLAWINLSKGPVILHVPEGKNSYYLVTVIDMDKELLWKANSQQEISGDFIFLPKDYKGVVPQGMTTVICQESIFYLEGRFSKETSGSYKGLTLESLAVYNGQDDPFKNYTPKLKSRKKMEELSLESFYAQSGTEVNLEVFDSASQKLLERHYKDFQKEINRYKSKTLEFIGERHQMGAYIDQAKKVDLWEVGALGVNALEDIAVAITSKDQNGEALFGGNKYSISFPAQQSPEMFKTGFWDLSLYDLEGNILSRPYSTASIVNLSFNSDGSLDIQVSNKKSKFTPKSNWISIEEKPFKVVLRIYNPNMDHYKEQWTLPIIINKTK